MDETTGFVTPPDPAMPGESGVAPDDNPDLAGASVYVEGVYVEGAGADVDDASAQGTTDDESTDDIRQGIEQTRASMSETIDAIQDRLSPQNLANQAKDALRDATIGKAERVMNDVSDAAKDTGSGLLAAIRQNPLPAALAGIGLGWLFMQTRSAAQQRTNGYNGYNAMYPPRYGVGGYYQGTNPNMYARDRGRYQTDQSSSMTDQARAAVGQVSDQAQQAGDWVQGQAQQASDWVQNQAQQASDQMQYQAQRMQGWFGRTLDESPLVLGVAALAAGALTGLAVPQTQQEHQLMGPARDSLVQQAGSAAQDAMSKIQDKVQDATQAAAQSASSQGTQQQNVMQ